MANRHIPDRELAQVTERDREYATDMMDDLTQEHGMSMPPNVVLETVALWIRKIRYEAVKNDRAKRGEAR
jgi:hypothetical protein